MIKILFLTDIDDTLIYSYKSKKEDDICIEYINDKMQGFITPKSKNLLNEISKDILLVPITTRSYVQYNRLLWENKPKYAFIDNGAIMLENDSVNENNNKHLKEIINKYTYKFDKLEKELNLSNLVLNVKNVDGIYLMVRAKDEKCVYDIIKNFECPKDIELFTVKRRIYLFPKEFSKGTAAKKICDLVKPNIVIAAGDSIIDLPMLKVADIAIVPNKKMASFLSKNQAIYINNKPIFSEFVLEIVLRIKEKYNEKEDEYGTKM